MCHILEIVILKKDLTFVGLFLNSSEKLINVFKQRLIKFVLRKTLYSKQRNDELAAASESYNYYTNCNKLLRIEYLKFVL